MGGRGGASGLLAKGSSVQQNARNQALNILSKAGLSRYDRLGEEPEVSMTAKNKFIQEFYNAQNGSTPNFGRSTKKTLHEIAKQVKYETLVRAKSLLGSDLDDQRMLKSYQSTSKALKNMQKALQSNKNW